MNSLDLNDLDLRLERLTRTIAQVRSELTSQAGRREALQEQLENREREVANAEALREASIEARELLRKLTDAKRELVRDKIERLVTNGIQTVFGPSYEFQIEQGEARGAVTFTYKIIHDFEGQRHTSDLRGHHGGGLVALVGFLLRVVMVLFTRPARRRLIVLDETMAALDGDKRSAFARLMVTLAQELDLQFLMVSHSPEYASEVGVTAYQVKMTAPGRSSLELLE